MSATCCGKMTPEGLLWVGFGSSIVIYRDMYSRERDMGLTIPQRVDKLLDRASQPVLAGLIEAALWDAVQQEREACAQIADKWMGSAALYIRRRGSP